MAENEAVETATTEETTQAEPVVDQETTSAETETTEPVNVAEEERKIPYVRFNKVVRERNEARETLAEKDRRIAELEAGMSDTSEDVDTADDSRAQARKMIEEDARAMLEREFGMPISEVKQRIAATDNYGQDYVERQWADKCSTAGVDPKDEDVQAFVGGLVNYQNVSLETALERASKRFGKTTKATPTASVEDGGVAGTMTKSDQVFWDRKTASEAAKKGIRSPHIDMMDIIAKQRAKSS